MTQMTHLKKNKTQPAKRIKRIIYRLTCEQCGNTFTASKPTARTCGPACRMAASRLRARIEAGEQIEIGQGGAIVITHAA